MKLINNLSLGVTISAIFSIVLLITSPAVAIPSDVYNIQLDNYNAEPNVELANVVAGIGSSVYASIFTFGGSDGSNLPDEVKTPSFSTANSWFIASIHQSNFSDHLQRAPSPVYAADGLSLHLAYGASMSSSAALNSAFAAAEALTSLYGVGFELQSFDITSNTYMFWANGSDTSELHSAVAENVDTLAGTNSLASVLNSELIVTNPVYWSGFGARTLIGEKVVQFGAGWVDDDGLQFEDNSHYTMSSNNIFGGPMTPNTDSEESLTRVTFTVPYPIEPIMNGISPQTSNPLPHVTGIAEWDLRNPVDYFSIGAQDDLVMSFKLKQDNTFPNIQNKFTINQTKLNTEGVMEAVFDITNIGSEVAEDLFVALPLGPDFGTFLEENSSILVINPDYYLDTDWNVDLSINVNSGLLGDVLTHTFLDFSGWYNYSNGNGVANWNDTDSLTLFQGDFTSSGITDTVTVSVSSTNGFPQLVGDLVDNQLAPLLASATSIADIQTKLMEALPTILQSTLDETIDAYYLEQDLFTFIDGNFSLGTYEALVSEDQLETHYYVTSEVDQLAAGDSIQLSFSIDDIPVLSDTFQFLEYEIGSTAAGGNDYPNATIVSYEENWFRVMQYFFELDEFDGRLLSYAFDSSVSFGLDELDSYHSDQYVSRGAFVYYENANDYPFFSMSNSQNLQIADDEAIVSAALTLDKQVYNPGQSKIITVDLQNSGDIAAENVKVHLYHATLGKGWMFERREKITTIDVGTLESGSSLQIEHESEANSFVGYSPVFAYIEFDSDFEQGSQELRDYLDLGVNEYQAAGQAHHIVFSTLTGALLLPAAGSVDLTPTIKEPKIDISKAVSELNEDGEFEVTYTIENTGEADTTVYFAQPYDLTSFELVSSTDDSSALKFERTLEEYNWGYVYYSQIQLDVGEQRTYTFTFKLLGDSGLIWPAWAYFSIAGDSTLGNTVDTGTESEVGDAQSMLSLSAGAQAQRDSQKSANENGASSSFSASSSVGASVNTNVNTEQANTVEGVGFVGFDAIGFLGLMAIPLGILSLTKKYRTY